MRAGFLRINQTSAGIQDADPVPGIDGIPLFRNFRFEDIRVHNAPVLVQATEISSIKMLDGLVLTGISGTCAKGISIANARQVELRDLDLTGYEGPLLSVANVTGSGITHAAQIAVPQQSSLSAEPKVPYQLH
jgi:hypothetical protein